MLRCGRTGRPWSRTSGDNGDGIVKISFAKISDAQFDQVQRFNVNLSAVKNLLRKKKLTQGLISKTMYLLYLEWIHKSLTIIN